MKWIIKHRGFNREQRRHDSGVSMLIAEGIKVGRPVPKNKPYVKALLKESK